jgi:hypothetical protein
VHVRSLRLNLLSPFSNPADPPRRPDPLGSAPDGSLLIATSSSQHQLCSASAVLHPRSTDGAVSTGASR